MVSRLNRSLLELKAACLNRECWKIQNPRGLHVAREDARLARRLQYTGRGCIPSDVLRKKASEGEGACSPTEARRPHLPYYSVSRITIGYLLCHFRLYVFLS